MQVAKVFKALGEGHRLRIVEFLAEGDQTVDELRRRLRISQSSTSQHLKLLHRAGLVTFTKHGNFRIYSLRRERLDKAMRYFDQLWERDLKKLKSKIEGPRG